MKVCLVSQEYPPETGGGGIGTQTYLKARGLSARGHEIHVVSLAAPGPVRVYKDADAVVHRIAAPALSAPGYELSTYWLAYSAAVSSYLAPLHDRIGFDIIQFPEYCGEGFVFQSDTYRYRTAKYVVQCHGPLSMLCEHLGWPERGSTDERIGTFMEGMALHRCDLVLASSHCTASFCAQRYDYPLEDIAVIHSGIEPGRFTHASRAASKGNPKLLFVGNLVATKGFDQTVEAVLRLRERHPDIVLRAIGREGDDRLRAIAARIEAHDAQSHFQLLGYVPYSELPDHYGWCDMFVGPSTYEPGPGNVYLEAMASSKPVIACNTGGTPEIVQHGSTGLLVPPKDVDALADAITALADNADLRARMGEHGRRWIEENVCLERYLDRVERLYRKALAS